MVSEIQEQENNLYDDYESSVFLDYKELLIDLCENFKENKHNFVNNL